MHQFVGFDKNVFNSIQESVQIWDARGHKIFSNNKASTLYEIDSNNIKTIDDIVLKWSFFDEFDKPLNIEELPASKAIHSHKEIKDQTIKMVSNENTKWVKTTATPVISHDGVVTHIITTCLDITTLKNEELKYKSIANYDPLTKLPNRMLLSDRLHHAIFHANRNKTKVAVCMIDLDGFKSLNDTLGHEAGDKLLIEVSKRMQKVVRVDDTVARLGGDEFVIILEDLGKSEDCAVTLYRLLNVISAPYNIDENVVNTISASIGVSIYPDDKVEADTLLRHADVAMYKSKNSGKNKFSFFDILSDQKIKANYKALTKIKKAVQNGEFELYYQPKINANSCQIVEVEALARWKHPLLGIISPSEFLPLIENDEELSNEFDNWVLTEAIKQLKIWQDENLYIKICVNISPRHFKQNGFIEKIEEIFKQYGLSLDLISFLEFEILETAAVENLNKSNEIIKECKKLGVSFALDDFGTGYSSLMHLKELSIDTIKIDKTFVSGMLECSENMAIVQAVTALANAFDIKVTAEGAESIEQVLSLIEIGCDEIQGFAISRPMPANEVKDFIEQYIADPRWKISSQTLPSKIDFELLLAESNHRYWVDMVLIEFEKRDIDQTKFSLDHKHCRFGEWFESTKQKNLLKTSTFKELDIAHKQIHHKVEEIYKDITSYKRTINKEEKQNIIKLSNTLTNILDKLRKELEISKQQKLINKISQRKKNHGHFK